MKLSINIFLLFFIVFFSSCSQDRIGYVDINKLYESFEYKKTMSAEFNKVKMVRQRVLDSLEFELNRLATEIEKGNKFNKAMEMLFEQKRKDLYELEKQYDGDNQILIHSYDEKIIKQLNAYIKEYGSNEHYKLIIGADNKGSLLYADETLDLTEMVIVYVNERYKGGQGNK